MDFTETVSGTGISWAICKSAPRSRQTTTPAPHRSVFFTDRMHFLPPNQQCTEGIIRPSARLQNYSSAAALPAAQQRGGGGGRVADNVGVERSHQLRVVLADDTHVDIGARSEVAEHAGRDSVTHQLRGVIALYSMHHRHKLAVTVSRLVAASRPCLGRHWSPIRGRRARRPR